METPTMPETAAAPLDAERLQQYRTQRIRTRFEETSDKLAAANAACAILTQETIDQRAIIEKLREELLEAKASERQSMTIATTTVHETAINVSEMLALDMAELVAARDALEELLTQTDSRHLILVAHLRVLVDPTLERLRRYIDGGDESPAAKAPEQKPFPSVAEQLINTMRRIAALDNGTTFELDADDCAAIAAAFDQRRARA